MNSDLHQQSKLIFQELSEADELTQQKRLAEIENSNPELAREIRSLLSFHTGRSILVPLTNTPKVRHRPTLSTTVSHGKLGWLQLVGITSAIAIPMLLVAGLLTFWTDHTSYTATKSAILDHLNDAVERRLNQFRLWESQQLAKMTAWSQDQNVAEAIEELVQIIGQRSLTEIKVNQKLLASPYQTSLKESLSLLAGHPIQFDLYDRRMCLLSSSDQKTLDSQVGQFAPHTTGTQLAQVILRGQPKLHLPNVTTPLTGDASELEWKGVAIEIPVRSKDGSVIAILSFHDPLLDQQFTELTAKWSKQPNGETYLINDRGVILTPSRYGNRLSNLPLAYIGTGPNQRIVALDPGTDLLQDPEFSDIPLARPLTSMARQITSGTGVNLDGYRNYAGRLVVGSWRWMEDHRIGIAFESHYEDAYGPWLTTRRSNILAMSLLTLTGLGIAYYLLSRLLKRRRFRDVSDAGHYQIQELIGEGGMGKVYLAEHALLCRQSAIKVLSNNSSDLSALSRFEREVQLASQLTHPNTIAIYDFGRTKEGQFYYAMEYINGAHLGQLVDYCGPLDPGRCIYILKQLCHALHEAHQAGAVHRDVKPQNIMVCNRGGEPDFVKLFDYGLVKSFAPGMSINASQTKIVVGTPRFMAPERLNSPWIADPRVDVYSVGALAYYLLTAQLPPLVLLDAYQEREEIGVETLDLPPSVVDFGNILSMCLSVEPSNRPTNIRSLLQELEKLTLKHPWTRQNSHDWWEKNESKLQLLVHNQRKKMLSNRREDSSEGVTKTQS